MRVGIAVYCSVCKHEKKPHGRSAPLGSYHCDEECSGYELDPKSGCLWPGETEDDFCYPICHHATKESGKL